MFFALDRKNFSTKQKIQLNMNNLVFFFSSNFFDIFSLKTAGSDYYFCVCIFSGQFCKNWR